MRRATENRIGEIRNCAGTKDIARRGSVQRKRRPFVRTIEEFNRSARPMPVEIVWKALPEEGRRDQMEPVPQEQRHPHLELDPSGLAHPMRKRGSPCPGGKPVGQQLAKQPLGPRPGQPHVGEGRDVHDPGALAYGPATLEMRYFTDPETCRAETDRLLARTWQFAGRSSQFENAGDFFTSALEGESLVRARGHDGEIRTFYNFCRHRSHQLVGGAGNASVLVCPYHAWTDELTGELRSGPNIQNVPGFNRSKVCLTAVRTEVFLCFIFVNLDTSAEPRDAWFPGARAELEKWVPHWRPLKPLEWIEIPERCNWKASIENYSESCHCAHSHTTHFHRSRAAGGL